MQRKEKGGKDEQKEAEENKLTRLRREKLQERKGGTWTQPLFYTKNQALCQAAENVEQFWHPGQPV